MTNQRKTHHPIVELIQKYDNKNYWSDFNIIPLKRPLFMAFYRQWVEQGYHASMSYLKEHLDWKENPQSLMSKARSIIVFRYPYLKHPHPNPDNVHLKLTIARYAQGKDYHLWIKDDLNKLIQYLKHHFPTEHFLPCVDSHPVCERDYAYQAGLGWFGKNSCLIHPNEGSFFFLAEILTSIDVTEKSPLTPIHDFCGKCTRCITACPTQAILPNRTIDSRRCLSYWNIEAQEIPPDTIKEQMGPWFFGCDICQEVCPWNAKPLSQLQKAQSSSMQEVEESLLFFLTASNKSIIKTLEGTPLLRARPFGLRRNAIIVAVNLKLHQLKPAIMQCIKKHPRLKPLEVWAETHL
ncbi:MAG: tRNA epoxyqueuosine(34) reductase QueG [Bdellovibrionaceae bacterium]|nr:tRNA epoxyqueuosine(34) reductase QueG [Pseudobdellovibrionaceae bacterium]MDW8190043.1 tRNA epoxyqueuosine(34) reductase QueG [Pseudobdellovibrionaceae bacterium]